MLQVKSFFSDLNVGDTLRENKKLVVALLSCASFIYLSKVCYFNGASYKGRIRLDGKTVIITGANTGIGKEAAKDLARRGARVIIACRDLKKGLAAVEEIKKETASENVILEMLDLASFESIRSFAAKINSREDNLNILINNAATIFCPRTLTLDGLESQFGVNHLGHYLLTSLLLEKLKKNAPSRIVNVASDSHESGRIQWDDINWEVHAYSPYQAYCDSKMCNVLYTRALAERLAGTGVTAYSLNPGFVRTDAFRHTRKSFGLMVYLVWKLTYPLKLWMLKSTKQGAQTIIYCAVAPELNGKSGGYYDECKEYPLKPRALDKDEPTHLWELSDKLILNKTV